MKIFRLSALLALPLICVLVATGCASSQPVVNTWRNPAFSPTPTNTIALKLHENPQPGDAETGQLLQAELQREGFALVPEERAVMGAREGTGAVEVRPAAAVPAA